MIKICDAVMNENGAAHGGLPGDQTGKELRERDFYDRTDGWDCCMVPTSATMAKKAVDFARRTVKSRRCGYDQDKRLTLYKAAKKVNFEPEKMEKCNADCSSFVSCCYIAAGVPDLSPACTTKNMVDQFMQTGYFVKRSGLRKYACPGAVFVKAGKHTFIVVETDELTQEEPQMQETDTRQRVMAKGSVWIRETPKTGKKITVAHKGDVLEIYGQDEATGWYKTTAGYITNNERYVSKC